MIRLGGLLALIAMVMGCSEPPAAPVAGETAASATPETPAIESEVPSMRNFAPLTIGAYDVQPMFEEEIPDGHYNIRVEGGDVAAVRIWAGDEAATDVMVVKTEIENDYYHGHVEVPEAITEDVNLWIEIETPSGETLKGSVPLEEEK